VQDAQATPHMSHVMVVSGEGFASHEQIALALNNILLSTAHGELRTSVQGAFRVAIPWPAQLLDRANDLSALGLESGRTATVPLIAPYPGVLHSYFVGDVLDATHATTVMLTNTTAMRTTLTLTFFAATGRTEIVRVRLEPHAHAALAVMRLVQQRGAGGLALAADHRVQVGVVMRAGRHRISVPGSVSAALRWSIAGNTAARPSQATIALLNPDPTRAATITLRQFAHGQRPHDVTVRLGALRARVVALPYAAGRPPTHLFVFADHPVVACLGLLGPATA
jgi:hypothetical protein